MKIYLTLFVVVLFAGLNSCSKRTLCDESLVIEKGTLNAQNVYTHPLIGLEWELPSDMQKKDLRNPRNQKSITLKELKELGSSNFFLAHMLNGELGETISFGFSYSETQNAEKDLGKLVAALKKMNKQLASNAKKKATVAIKQEKINFAGEQVDYMYIQTEEGTRGQLLKNFGCYNFFVALDYSSKEQKEKLIETLSHAKYIK